MSGIPQVIRICITAGFHFRWQLLLNPNEVDVRYFKCNNIFEDSIVIPRGEPTQRTQLRKSCAQLRQVLSVSNFLDEDKFHQNNFRTRRINQKCFLHLKQKAACSEIKRQKFYFAKSKYKRMPISAKNFFWKLAGN